MRRKATSPRATANCALSFAFCATLPTERPRSECCQYRCQHRADGTDRRCDDFGSPPIASCRTPISAQILVTADQEPLTAAHHDIERVAARVEELLDLRKLAFVEFLHLAG